jgi:hypothetical protein
VRTIFEKSRRVIYLWHGIIISNTTKTNKRSLARSVCETSSKHDQLHQTTVQFDHYAPNDQIDHDLFRFFCARARDHLKNIINRVTF